MKKSLLNIVARLISAAEDRTLDFKAKQALKGCKSVGTGIVYQRPLHLVNPGKIEIGDYVYFGSNVVIDGRGGLVIGSHTVISDWVTILTADHQYDGVETIPFGKAYIDRAVTVSECVWIGCRVSVTPGVTIGKGAIVGMGAVVADDIPEYAIACGNPARVMKYRDIEGFKTLDEKGKYFLKERLNG